MTTTITTISNQLSRRIEARADSFALTLTGEPEPFISFEKRIAMRNLSDPTRRTGNVAAGDAPADDRADRDRRGLRARRAHDEVTKL